MCNPAQTFLAALTAFIGSAVVCSSTARAVTLLELAQREDAKQYIYYVDENKKVFIVVRKMGNPLGSKDRILDEIYAGPKDNLEKLEIVGFSGYGRDHAFSGRVQIAASEGDVYRLAHGGELMESSIPPFNGFRKDQDSARVRIRWYLWRGIIRFAAEP
jgi:hypothetical protein